MESTKEFLLSCFNNWISLWLECPAFLSSLVQRIRRIAQTLILVRREFSDFMPPFAKTNGINGVSVVGLPFSQSTVRFKELLFTDSSEPNLAALSMTDAEREWLERWFTSKYDQTDNADQWGIIFRDLFPSP